MVREHDREWNAVGSSSHDKDCGCLVILQIWDLHIVRQCNCQLVYNIKFHSAFSLKILVDK